MRVARAAICICVILVLVACVHKERHSELSGASEAVAESSAALPSHAQSASPVPSVEPAGEEPSTEVIGAATDPLGDLSLHAESTEYGFRVVDSNGMDLSVEMTFAFPSIDGVDYGVHIVNRTDEHGFRKDAIVVNPKSEAIEVYPLYRVNANQKSLFVITSIANAYGLIADRYLLFISALDKADRTEGYGYRVETLDIVSGERNNLMSLELDLVEMPYMTAAWSSIAGNTIFMNTPLGDSWTIDYNEREIKQLKKPLENPMPFNNMQHSPDGERFWLPDSKTPEYRLYDLQGTMLSRVPRGKGYSKNPIFRWSPDSRFSVRQSTRDEGEDRVISQGGDFAEIAPQIIQLFDRQGTLLRTVETAKGSGGSIEFAGWLDGTDDIILCDYDLDRSDEAHPVKRHLQYRLLNLRSGEEQPLRIADDITLLDHPVPARLSSYNLLSSIAAVDKDRSLIAVVAEYGTWESEPGQDRMEWVEIRRDANSAIYHLFDKSTKRSAEQEIVGFSGELARIGEEWLQSGMHSMQIKPIH